MDYLHAVRLNIKGVPWVYCDAPDLPRRMVAQPFRTYEKTSTSFTTSSIPPLGVSRKSFHWAKEKELNLGS
ncbi:hypothetical protein PG995_000444 [Apiospora arundinis]